MSFFTVFSSFYLFHFVLLFFLRNPTPSLTLSLTTHIQIPWLSYLAAHHKNPFPFSSIERACLHPPLSTTLAPPCIPRPPLFYRHAISLYLLFSFTDNNPFLIYLFLQWNSKCYRFKWILYVGCFWVLKWKWKHKAAAAMGLGFIKMEERKEQHGLLLLLVLC